MKYNSDTDGPAWLQDARAYLQRSDLRRATLRQASLDLRIPIPTMQHRMQRLGTSWVAERERERIRRLDEQLEDAPRSTPDLLVMLLGFSWQPTFEMWFKQIKGMTFYQWRQAQGLPPAVYGD